MLGSASPSRDCGNPEANAAGGMVLEVTISPSDAFMCGVAVVTTTTRGVLVAGRRSQTKISGTAQCGKPETVGKPTRETGPGTPWSSERGPALGLRRWRWLDSNPRTETASASWRRPPRAHRAPERSWETWTMGTSSLSASTIRRPSKRPAGGALQRHVVLYGREGELKGLQGKGKYTVTVNADGTSTVAVEGDYTIAEPTPNAAKQKSPSQ